MVTSPAGYKIKSVSFKPTRWIREIILNGNEVSQAKKKLIVLQNWNLGLSCHSKTLKNKVLLWKMVASGKEIFI
jgi:hypothetical protein